MFEAPVAASSLADTDRRRRQGNRGRVIAWRRDIHANPELGNREFRTAGIVAEHLKRLGLDEVRTGVAHTGVVGLLKGALPGPVVALRADMDALPVAEEVDLPFASKVKAQWNGEIGRRHARLRPRRPRRHPDGRGRGARRAAQPAARLGQVHLPAGRGAAARGRGGRREDDGRRGRAREAGAAGGVRPARHLAAGARRARLPPGADHGQRRFVQHQGRRPADARRHAVVRRRPDRHRGAGRARPADGGQPPGRPHPRAGGRDRRHDQGRRAPEHHPRLGRDARHDPQLRRGDARRHPRARHHISRNRSPGARAPPAASASPRTIR